MFKMGYRPNMGQKEQAARAVNVRALELIRSAFEASEGMTQQQLAEATGIPRSTLANVLSKTAEPRLLHVEQLVLIAMALGADARQWIAELEALARRERGDGGVASVTPIRPTPSKPSAPRRKMPRVAKKSGEQAGAPEE